MEQVHDLKKKVCLFAAAQLIGSYVPWFFHRYTVAGEYTEVLLGTIRAKKNNGKVE